MPSRRYQVRLQGNSLMPKDVYENILYFDNAGIDSEEDTCDGIAAVYADANCPIGGVANMTIKVYALEGGQPTFQKDYPLPGKSRATGPGEVACCLSYTAANDVDAATPRRRGRIFIGPLHTLFHGDERPGGELQDRVLNMGTAFAQIGFASNTTWEMFSVRDQVTANIEAIYVDNAWDTQRRRGLAPTARQVRDVQ